MATLEFDNVWKRYGGGTVAVKSLTLSVEDGEFVILVGPSGCGKSTALRMVAGLEEISEGSLRIGERVVNALTPKQRDIAMVFQSYALYPHMTVAENMGFALKLARVPKDEIVRRVRHAAEILDLGEHLQRKPRALSGGQRQRVAMGRAIVRNPQVFLMDEPLSNLDAKLRVQMRAEISQLQSSLGVTTLYVTHDQIEAMTMGDRVAVLKRGELQQVDTPQCLYHNPDNLFVAGFIGSPAMNIAVADVVQEDGQCVVKLGSITLPVTDGAVHRYPRVRDYTGQRIAVGLRPEHFTRELSGATVGTMDIEVKLVEALGSDVLVHFKTDASPVMSDDIREAVDDDDAFANIERAARTGAHTFVARIDPKDIPRAGDQLKLAFHSDELHFFDLERGTALR